MRNWVYYMQQGLKSMWSKKSTKRTTLAGVEISKKKKNLFSKRKIIKIKKRNL